MGSALPLIRRSRPRVCRIAQSNYSVTVETTFVATDGGRVRELHRFCVQASRTIRRANLDQETEMKFLATMVSAACLLGGCATTGEIEKRQLAYDGTGSNPCLWGGVTEKADAHCAEVRCGTIGYLTAINSHARRALPEAEGSAPCQVHVARLQAALSERSDLRSQAVYSCPPQLSGQCHLSLLVTDASGAQYVLDNGAVFGEAQAASGVGTLQRYSELAGNHRLVAPSHSTVAALE
jgi:hypothetical protein